MTDLISSIDLKDLGMAVGAIIVLWKMVEYILADRKNQQIEAKANKEERERYVQLMAEQLSSNNTTVLDVSHVMSSAIKEAANTNAVAMNALTEAIVTLREHCAYTNTVRPSSLREPQSPEQSRRTQSTTKKDK
ncbi:MAG: hypothetical protein ACYC27_18695 [Armatimonadota bacterium]